MKFYWFIFYTFFFLCCSSCCFVPMNEFNIIANHTYHARITDSFDFNMYVWTSHMSLFSKMKMRRKKPTKIHFVNEHHNNVMTNTCTIHSFYPPCSLSISTRKHHLEFIDNLFVFHRSISIWFLFIIKTCRIFPFFFLLNCIPNKIIPINSHTITRERK